MAVQVKCLLYKHNGLSSNPQDPCKMQDVSAHPYNPRIRNIETGGSPGLADSGLIRDLASKSNMESN